MNDYITINNISILPMMNKDFHQWIFHAGMLFGSMEKWWGTAGMRKYPHEGVDFCMFKDINGQIHNIDSQFQIAAHNSGKVYRIIDDFIGKTIFIGHEIYNNNLQLFTVYGHTDRLMFKEGFEIIEGEIIGGVAESMKIDIKTHLHITMAWLPENIPIEHLNWQTLNDPYTAQLIDPLKPKFPVIPS